VKTVISFICGFMLCGTVFISARTVLPILADTSGQDAISDNASRGIMELIPDFEVIYREALTQPFIKAESKIYDEDIAEYYRGLLDSTGLR
jgi:hypothetical protein